MSKFYKKLNLPANPFVSGFDITTLTVNRPGAGQLQPTADLALLNQETVDAYRSVGLEPERIFVLGNKSFPDDDPEFEVRCAAHKDMYWINDHWEYQLFAINYELTPDKHKVGWKFWDITAKEIFPGNPTTEEATWLAGQHYNARQTGNVPNYGDPNDYHVIEQFILDRPTLCKVDVAHSIHHTNAQEQRYGISVRFKHNLKNWGDVVNQLSSLIVE
jgi:hypothetical protein